MKAVYTCDAPDCEATAQGWEGWPTAPPWGWFSADLMAGVDGPARVVRAVAVACSAEHLAAAAIAALLGRP